MSRDLIHNHIFPDEPPPGPQSSAHAWAGDGWNFDDLLSDGPPDDNAELSEIDWDFEVSQALHAYPPGSHSPSPLPPLRLHDQQHPAYGSLGAGARDIRYGALFPAAGRAGDRVSAPHHSCENCAPIRSRPVRQYPWQYRDTDDFRAHAAVAESGTSNTRHDLSHDPSSGCLQENRLGPEVNAMPAREIQRPSGHGYVDLTTSPTIPSPEPRRRTEPRALKRTADEAFPAASSSRTTKRTREEPASPVEELDLTNENPSADDELLGNQQAAAIAAQQEESSSTARIGKRQCIICMENYTNLTVTHCGHVYCHECLSQALMAGEKNGERKVGTCPVCRKPVRRTKDGKGSQMALVNFLTKKAYAKKGRQKADVDKIA